MNKSHQAIQQSWDRILEFVEDHSPLWSEGDPIAGSAAEITQFSDSFTSLGREQQLAALRRKKANTDKRAAFKELEKQTRKIIQLTRAFKNLDPGFASQLQTESMNTQSQWLELAQDTLDLVGQKTDAIVAMSGVESTFLQPLQTAVDHVLDAEQRATDAEVERLGMTQQMKSTVKTGAEVVQTMDAAIKLRFIGNEPLLAQWARIKRRHDLYRTPDETATDGAQSEPATTVG